MPAAVGRTASATSEILRGLDDRDLGNHDAFEGASLTEEGCVQTAERYQTSLTLARIFHDGLDIQSTEEALQLADVVDADVPARLQ